MIVAANFLVAGCAGGPPTASGCASSAAQAVRSRVEVTGIPASCRGLGPAALDQAIGIAVSELADNRDKALRRHLVVLARAHLGFLIIPAQRVAAAAERAAANRAAAERRHAAGAAASTVRSPGTRVPVRLAALAAWLLTAGSGSVLLRNWFTHGRRRRGARSRGPFRGLVFSHFGLALGGLSIWIGYLLTRWAPLAWIAFAILLPVAGLGMATLIDAIPDPDRDRGFAAVRKRRMPVVMIAAHGLLATATLLLALLGSVAALRSR